MHMFFFSCKKKYIETKLKLKQFQSMLNLLFKAMTCAQPNILKPVHTHANEFLFSNNRKSTRTYT